MNTSEHLDHSDHPEAQDDLEADVSLDEPRDKAGEALTARRRRALAEARRNDTPAPRESWRKRTATGAVLTGFALGFREALGMEPQRAAIVMEAPGDPPSDLPVEAEVDQIRPGDNVVRIRPWLLANGDPEADTDVDGEAVDTETRPDTAHEEVSDEPAAADTEADAGLGVAADTALATADPDENQDEPDVSATASDDRRVTAVPGRRFGTPRRRGRQ